MSLPKERGFATPPLKTYLRTYVLLTPNREIARKNNFYYLTVGLLGFILGIDENT